MLKIDPTQKKFTRLTPAKLTDSDHWERHVQDMICRGPRPFFDEIGEKLLLIGQEVRPWEGVPDRVDILAVDEDGTGVIVELKRGTNKLQLLQAISYAGMISRWSQHKFVEALANAMKQATEEAQAALEQHLLSEFAKLNQSQRIVLVAEDFDPALLVSAEWLYESYGVDIRCYRIALSQEAENEYMTCGCIYPPLEIASLTRRAGASPGPAADSWSDWDAALESVDNSAMVAFFRKALAQRHENRLRYREVIYRFDEKRRFYVSCRRRYAYVWQAGRFVDDLEYWKRVLSTHDTVTEVKEGQALRFHLERQADFDAFANAMSKDLRDAKFSELADFEGPRASE